MFSSEICDLPDENTLSLAHLHPSLGNISVASLNNDTESSSIGKHIIGSYFLVIVTVIAGVFSNLLVILVLKHPSCLKPKSPLGAGTRRMGGSSTVYIINVAMRSGAKLVRIGGNSFEMKF